jgi:hypothetical protein
MAEIFNARDLILQGTVPRLTVTAVTILPEASGFLKDKNVLALSPATLNLTTVLVGFTAAATYDWYYASSLNPTTFTLLVSGTSYTSYSITNTAFLTHVGLGTSVIYKCKVTQPGWADAETTTTINYTKRANDVPVATLNKTSIVLPTTADDLVDYANSGSRITVSIGGVNIPYAASGSNSFSIATPTISSGTIVVDAAPTTETTTVTNDTRVYANLSAMAAGNAAATITYTVTARDVDGVATTIPLTQTISKATSGTAGYVYTLTTPSIVVREQDNINFTPTTITASATLAIGQAAASAYSGIFKVYTSTNDGVSYTLRNTSTVTSSYVYTLQDYASVRTTNIKVELYLANGVTLIDTEVISVNLEGQYALNLTNDNHTVSTGISGTATGLSITSEAEIYLGLTKQTTGWTFSWVASAGITITGAATSTVTVTGVTADGIVTVTATQTSTGLTRTGVFTISRAITGATGANSFRIDLSNDNQTVRINAAGAVTSTLPSTTVTVYNGSAVDSGWTLSAAYSNINITGSFGSAVTVNPNIFSITGFPAAAGLDGYVDISATKSGYATLTARFTLTKTSNAVIYSLVASADSVNKNTSGVSTPSALTFTAYQIDGNNTATLYSAGTITIQAATSGGAFANVVNGVVASSSSYTISNNTTFVNIKGILNVGGIIDSETVPILSDGIAGKSVYTGTVYLQAASVTAPSGGSYNFSNGVLTPPTNTGAWSITQPASTTIPTWACDYTFVASSNTETVTAGTWTNLHIDAVKGDAGTGGTTSALVELYKTGGGTLPGSCTYTFSSGTISGTLNSWSLTMPASSTSGVYMTTQLFTAIAPADNATGSAWSNAVLVAQNGSNGDPGSGTFVINRGAAATNTAPTSAEITAAAIGRPSGNGIAGDIVTIYNNANNNAIWRCTASGTPGTWTTQASYLTGDLIVSGTITANKLASGAATITSGNIFELGQTNYGYAGVITGRTATSGAFAVQGFNTVANGQGGGVIGGGISNQYAVLGLNATNNNFNILNSLGVVGGPDYGVIGRRLNSAGGVGNNDDINDYYSEGLLATTSEGGLFKKYAGGVVTKQASIANASYAVEATTGSMRSDSYNFASTTSIYLNATPAVVIAVSNSTAFESRSTLNVSYKGISPSGDNATGLSLGTTGARWTEIWAANGTIQTSDSRLKTDIQNSNLGLNFINQLRPVSYKFISGGKVETGEIIETPVPGTDNVHREPVYEDVPGVRTHYGLIAQEVKTTLDNLNTGDFGGFVLGDKTDPNSRHHLRYDEFISPLIKAIQELSAKVTALENRLNS